MDEILLEVEPRSELGKSKVKDIRHQGFIPCVVYAEGKESKAVKVSHKRFFTLIHQHRIESAIINLTIKDEERPKPRACLIKEIQYHPVTGDIVHVDFNEVSLTKAIKVSVPVATKGESIGVKQEGGSLEHILWEIEVECLPTDIPKEIPVDISQLKMGNNIHIKDIAFPANVKVLHDPDAIVLTIASPMKEEVVAPAGEGEAAAQEPEVIKEKKEELVEGAAPEGKEKEKEKEKEKDKDKEKKAEK